MEGPKENWEIWAMPGMALLIPENDPDKPKLTKTLALKHQMRNVTEDFANRLFDKVLPHWVDKKPAPDLTPDADPGTTDPEATPEGEPL